MILITGGGGFIGLNLAHDLVERGQTVLLLRRHNFELPSFLTPFAPELVRTIHGDLNDPAFLDRVISEYAVESIVHAAVITESTPGSTLFEAVQSNVQGTAVILEAARRARLRRVTFLSSISVYFPYTQDHPFLSEENDLPAGAPEWIGATKKAGEQICQLYAQQYGLSVPIVRPAQVWGPLYWTGRSPIMAMVQNSLEGKPADLSSHYGGGRSSYIYVRDCAQAISLIHLAPSLKFGLYNLGDGEHHSLEDFSRALKSILPSARISLGSKAPPGYREAPPLSITRLQQELGFRRRYSLEEGLEAYLAWLKDGSYQ